MVSSLSLQSYSTWWNFPRLGASCLEDVGFSKKLWEACSSWSPSLCVLDQFCRVSLWFVFGASWSRWLLGLCSFWFSSYDIRNLDPFVSWSGFLHLPLIHFAVNLLSRVELLDVLHRCDLFLGFDLLVPHPSSRSYLSFIFSSLSSIVFLFAGGSFVCPYFFWTWIFSSLSLLDQFIWLSFVLGISS